MLSIPDRFDAGLPSMFSLLTRRYGKVYTVHRLDKDTSGIILFAKNEKAHRYLSQLFENRKIEKQYRAILKGCPHEGQGTLDGPIAEHPNQKGMMIVHPKGKPSVTHYEVKENFGIYSMVNFSIETGRMHQIRVHAATMGHPVAADPLYGDGKPILLSSFKKKYRPGNHDAEERPLLSRTALHATLIKFKLPSGDYIELEAPLPKDMKALTNQLEKWRH